MSLRGCSLPPAHGLMVRLTCLVLLLMGVLPHGLLSQLNLCANHVVVQTRGAEAGEHTCSARRVLLLMGSRFEFGAYAKTQALADSAVSVAIAEVERIEGVISDWRDTTEVAAVNRAAGVAPVGVSRELLELVRRSLRVSELTEGAFDITAGGLRGLYRFGKQDTVLPTAEVLAKAQQLVDYKLIHVDVAASTIYLSRQGMRIGFGANGKGYAANRALHLMRQIEGVTGAVANASGDMATWGSDGSGRPWIIAITDPRHPDRNIGHLELNEVAVVTSGDYEKYFTAQGQRYSHILDPRTALPTTGTRSVTVICPDAELADALATAMFVMGPEQALALANRLRNVEALVIDQAGNYHRSDKLQLRDVGSDEDASAKPPTKPTPDDATSSRNAH